MNRIIRAGVTTAMLVSLCSGPVAAGASAARLPGRTAASTAAAARLAGLTVVPRRAASARAGYVWSTSTSGGQVAAFYSFSTSGGGVTMNHAATGMYVVGFPGLGAVIANPEVQVTTYGPASARTCNVVAANAVGTTLIVGVECFSYSGAPADALFDLMVSKPRKAFRGVLDYAVDATPSASGPLTGDYNSSGRINRVRHLGTGMYQVIMPGPGTAGITGTVKVSPLTQAGGECTTVGWRGTRSSASTASRPPKTART